MQTPLVNANKLICNIYPTQGEYTAPASLILGTSTWPFEHAIAP